VGPGATRRSHGIEAIGASTVLVTDAGNNDLLLVRPTATSSRSRASRPGWYPGPTSASRPTSRPRPSPPPSLAPDGYWYVGQLLGFPFTPGESTIWRIAPWAREAVCDDDTSDGCAPYMSGFSAIVGIELRA